MIDEKEQAELDFAIDMACLNEKPVVWSKDGKIGIQVGSNEAVEFKAAPGDIIAYLIGGTYHYAPTSHPTKQSAELLTCRKCGNPVAPGESFCCIHI